MQDDQTIPDAPAAVPQVDASNNTPALQPNSVAATPNSVTPETPPDKTEPEVKPDPETPDWFMKDKFKSVDEQAKSYKELSTKMGKFWGSPQENYSIEGLTGIDAADPLIANLTPALKEMGISQDGFNHLVSQYMEANMTMVKGMEEALKKELTETDAHTYHSIEKWMTDNLTPDEATMVKNNWLMSAADFKLFNHLRLMAAPSTSVPSATTNPVKFESSKEVTNDKIKYKTELKEGKRVVDRNYEDLLAARFRDAATRELRNKGR